MSEKRQSQSQSNLSTTHCIKKRQRWSLICAEEESSWPGWASEVRGTASSFATKLFIEEKRKDAGERQRASTARRHAAAYEGTKAQHLGKGDVAYSHIEEQ
jgi:hypothetical protein